MLVLVMSNMLSTATLVREDLDQPSLSIVLNRICKKHNNFGMSISETSKKANSHTLFNEIVHAKCDILDSITNTNLAIECFNSKFYKILGRHIPY